MKETKIDVVPNPAQLGLDTCFETLVANLTHAIDTLDDIKVLKPARKELKKYRLAIAAIQRQVRLYEKDNKI